METKSMKTKSENLYLIQEKKYENDKLVDTTSFDENGNIISVDYRKIDKTFDVSGNLLRHFEEKIGETGEVLYFWEHTYEYDDKGNCLKRIFNQNNDVGYTVRHFYDKKTNRRVKTKRGSRRITYYEYDEKGNCTDEFHYFDSRLWLRDEKKYRKGLLLQEKVFKGEKGELGWINKYKYNEKNLKIEENTFDQTGALKRQVLTHYDENNIKTKQEIFEITSAVAELRRDLYWKKKDKKK